MLQLDNEGKHWRTGETQDCVVLYVNSYTNQSSTYYPNFIMEDVRMIECKPINLQNTMMVRTSARATKDFCESRGWLYELTDVILILGTSLQSSNALVSLSFQKE